MQFFKKIDTKIESQNTLTLLCVLCLVGVFLYGKSTLNGFVWDDPLQITNNQYIQSLSFIPRLFLGSTFGISGTPLLLGLYYKPLMPVVFSLIHSLWQLNPFGYHFFDLLLHIINAILLYFFFKKILEIQSMKSAKSIAWVVSLIFLIHPANVESVAYISSTQELLYVFFLLLSTLLTIQYCSKQSLLTFCIIQLCFFASLLSKESGILAMLLCLTYLFIFFRKFFLQFMLGSLVILGIYFFLRLAIAHVFFTINSEYIPIQSATLLQRLATIPYEISSYVRIFFFPKDLFINQDDIIRSFADPRFFIGLVVSIFTLVAMTYFLVKLHSKILLFFTLWIIFGFGMLLNIFIPLDMTIAERWMYGPIIGLLGFCVIVMVYIISLKPQLKVFFMLLIIGILPVFFMRSFIRIDDWNNEDTLFSHALVFEHESFSLYNDYANTLFNNGKYDESKKYYFRSIRMNPYQFLAYNGLDGIYYLQGDTQKADYYLALALAHAHGVGITTYEHAAIILSTTAPLSVQKTFLLRAISYIPQDPLFHELLAVVYKKQGNVLQAEREQKTVRALTNNKNIFLNLSQ